MLFFDRCDGRRVRGLHALNAMMPYLMRGRNESAVYYNKEINLENALAFIRLRKNSHPELADELTLFGLILAAALRTVALLPRLNRFIHRRAFYDRNHIAFAFIVKQKFEVDAPEVNAKVFLDPHDDLDTVCRKTQECILTARAHGEGDGERFVNIFHHIPGGKALLMGVYRLLDTLNLAPWSLLRMDPMYSTAYFANLGSLGLDAPFHHLYEWGTCGMFIVLGKLHTKEVRHGPNPIRQRYMDFRVSIDERIADGFYFAKAAAVFNRLISDPALLTISLEEVRRELGMELELAPSTRE